MIRHHIAAGGLLLAAFLTLSGCQKDVLQPARDTVLENLSGDVKSVVRKVYHATKGENDKDYKMGEMTSFKSFEYSPEGMLLIERTIDKDSVIIEEKRHTYDTKGETTTITSEEWTEVVSRDLDKGTRTRTFKGKEGKTMMVFEEKIDAKGLPLRTVVKNATGDVTRSSNTERDVYGHVTMHEVFVGDSLIYRVASTLNKNGDPVSELETNARDTIENRAFVYNYDDKGNWIRRVTRHMPKGKSPYYTLSERAIVYY